MEKRVCCPGYLGLGRLNTLAADFLETTPLLDYSGHPVPVKKNIHNQIVSDHIVVKHYSISTCFTPQASHLKQWILPIPNDLVLIISQMKLGKRLSTDTWYYI